MIIPPVHPRSARSIDLSTLDIYGYQIVNPTAWRLRHNFFHFALSFPVMIDTLPLPADIALRLVGAFYILAAPLIIHAGASTLFLTRAINAISMKVSKADQVEEQRIRFLFAMALLTGAGGILLAARLDLAFWVFVANAAIYALYLYWLAPRYFDRWDEPDDKGRRQTRNAFIVYLVATAIVASAWRSGALRPVAAEHPAVLAICAAAFAGLVYYAFRSLRLARPIAPVATAETDDFEPQITMPERMVLTPSWIGNGLVDAETGEQVWIYGVGLPHQLVHAITEWLGLFRQCADPDDPWRRDLLDPADRARVEEAGRLVYEALVKEFGQERVSFEPDARPCPTASTFAAMKVCAGFESEPIWEMKEGDYESSSSPHHIGISWRLAEDLIAWGLDYDGSFENGDPEGRRLWTPEEAARHREQGLSLAKRLSREFAVTQREDIPVWYQPEGEKAFRVHP